MTINLPVYSRCNSSRICSYALISVSSGISVPSSVHVTAPFKYRNPKSQGEYTRHYKILFIHVIRTEFVIFFCIAGKLSRAESQTLNALVWTGRVCAAGDANHSSVATERSARPPDHGTLPSTAPSSPIRRSDGEPSGI